MGVTRMNPLFVDSTKLFGETITSQIELEGLTLREGEKVFAKIIKKNGDEDIVPLKGLENGRFEGRTWLGHQESITLQFFVSANQVVVLSSKPKSMPATYVICEKWQPYSEPVREPKPEPKKKMSLWKESLVFDWVNES